MTADYNKWSDTLARVGISKSAATNVETLSTELRRLFVQEIVGERCEIYENCIIQEGPFDYLTEANKFHKDGFYASVACLML